MATNLPLCFFIQLLEQLLKFLVNFTLLKCYVSEKLWLFNHKRADFWLDLKVHFSASLIISLGLPLRLPKDSGGVGDVNENSQKAEIKIQTKSLLKKRNWMAKSSSVMSSIIQLKPSFSRISPPAKLIPIYKMFKLQYYLLILTFSRVYKNQKGHYQNYWGTFGRLAPQ